jgi:branched-chain amino acid transport system substrate-binding protein
LKAAGLTAGAYAAAPLLNACAPASSGAVRIGVLLPFSGVYASLGEGISTGMQMYLEGAKHEAAGRPIELIVEDEGTQPDAALQKMRKLVEQDQVDFVTGIVSSAVLIAVRDYLDANQKLLICSNAGANNLSRGSKTPYIWRTSFTNWMPNWPVGGWAARNVGKTAILSVPDYTAGVNTVTSFQNSFEAAGGRVIGVQKTPFPNLGDPASFITEIASSGADFLYCFYSGGAAVTFLKAYGEFGLSGKLPLLCSGFMVGEDVLPAQGETALGVRGGLHWAIGLDNAENEKLVEAYRRRTGMDANVFVVQGYDTGRVIVEMLGAVQGDTADVEGMIAALGGIRFDSPRGSFALDAKTQAPRHHIYLREVQRVDGALRNVVLEDLGEVVDPGDDSKG